MSRIKSINKKYIQNETLHDLSVKDDESYIANGIAVHNCRSVWVYFFKGEDYNKSWMDKSDTQLKQIYKTDNIKSIRNNYTNGAVGFGKA